MRQLNGIYTQRYHRRHRAVEHLFQGRYKGHPNAEKRATCWKSVATWCSTRGRVSRK
jgi:hypothetical protein